MRAFSAQCWHRVTRWDIGAGGEFLDGSPEADANEILIGWPDEGEQAQLIDFAKKPSASGRDAWPKELSDGCANLLRQQQKS